MASSSSTTDLITSNQQDVKPKKSGVFRWACQPRMSVRRRRRVVPTVRLGGKKTEKKLFLVGIFRRVKLRWLKVKLKKLKDYYHCLVKDVIEGGGSIETVQQRLLMETSFAIPVMGLSFNTFPTARNLFI